MKSDPAGLPSHIAIVMDGNGRWAEQRKRPRTFGHQAGQKALRRVVEHCGKIGVPELTVFAFSSENWRRPKTEVGLLMDLFVRTLRNEVQRLDRNGVRMRFIGDRSAFDPKLRALMDSAEQQTADNTAMTLVVAVNYGGRWDLAQAAQRLAMRVASGELQPEAIDSAALGRELCIADLPEPDLFIRTGGEYRISNFLLWQLAYTELYFTDVLWPDFREPHFKEALEEYARRRRRFGDIE